MLIIHLNQKGREYVMYLTLTRVTKEKLLPTFSQAYFKFLTYIQSLYYKYVSIYLTTICKEGKYPT